MARQTELRILRLIAEGFRAADLLDPLVDTPHLHQTLYLYRGRERRRARWTHFRTLIERGLVAWVAGRWTVTEAGKRDAPRVFLGCAQPRMYVAVGIPLSPRQKRNRARHGVRNPS